MKKIIPAAAAAAAVALLMTFAGCTESAKEPAADNPLLASPVPAGMVRGTVLEMMEAAGYTYVLLDTGEEEVWVAGPASSIAVGDIVQAATNMPMADFTSKSLDRTFAVLYFADALQNLSATPASAPVVERHPEPAPVDRTAFDIDVAPLEPGKDIAYVYANKEALAGQTISLRGEVVRYNKNIMDMNFIHIRDGSGSAAEGNNDLTVTSTDRAKVGETIVVTGKILLDKDLGAGYTYPVMMDDANLSKE